MSAADQSPEVPRVPVMSKDDVLLDGMNRADRRAFLREQRGAAWRVAE